MRGSGFLAIWSDVSDARLTDYLHWLTREHTTERMGVQGFVAVRVFRAVIENVNRFLIIYELEGPEALSGQPYLDRLNDPTPWSQRIMPILQNFIRGGGRRKISRGIGRGGYLAALPRQTPLEWPEDVMDGLASQDRIAAVHLLETDRAKTAIQTDEKKLRGEDKSFDSLVLVEGLDQAALRKALTQFQAVLPPGMASADVPLYALMFALDGRRWPQE